jgi:hypothetical protein
MARHGRPALPAVTTLTRGGLMHMTKLALALGIAATLGLSGCYESGDVTLAEAGKYKGEQDPLLNQQVSSRTESLKKRFQLVQADR